MLKEMLEKNKGFQAQSPKTKDTVLKLAAFFVSDEDNLARTPQSLAKKTNIPKEQWSKFLALDPVQAYIKGQLTELKTIGERKAIRTLIKEMESGNIQAAKEMNNLMSQGAGGNKTVIILHSVPRPKGV